MFPTHKPFLNRLLKFGLCMFPTHNLFLNRTCFPHTKINPDIIRAFSHAEPEPQPEDLNIFTTTITATTIMNQSIPSKSVKILNGFVISLALTF